MKKLSERRTQTKIETFTEPASLGAVIRVKQKYDENRMDDAERSRSATMLLARTDGE